MDKVYSEIQLFDKRRLRPPNKFFSKICNLDNLFIASRFLTSTATIPSLAEYRAINSPRFAGYDWSGPDSDDEFSTEGAATPVTIFTNARYKNYEPKKILGVHFNIINDLVLGYRQMYHDIIYYTGATKDLLYRYSGNAKEIIDGKEYNSFKKEAPKHQEVVGCLDDEDTVFELDDGELVPVCKIIFKTKYLDDERRAYHINYGDEIIIYKKDYYEIEYQ